MKYREFAILWKVHHRIAVMQAITMEIVQRYVEDGMDASCLAQAALDRAVEGDYLGAMVLEEAAKLVTEDKA